MVASSGRVSHFLFVPYYCGFTLTRVFDELGTSFQLRFRSRFVRVPFAFRSRFVSYVWNEVPAMLRFVVFCFLHVTAALP